jgi:hypothetical protein
MNPWSEAVWRQFGAAIDTLGDAIQACPESQWRESLWQEPPDSPLPPGFAEFWYLAYHTMFWLDLYLFGSGEGFVPRPPFTDAELDPAGKLPEKPYTQEELLEYVSYVRRKCEGTLTSMTEEDALRPCAFPWTRGKPVSYVELQLYNLRHVQEHAAQLNMFLGQRRPGSAPRWVARG